MSVPRLLLVVGVAATVVVVSAVTGGPRLTGVLAAALTALAVALWLRNRATMAVRVQPRLAATLTHSWPAERVPVGRPVQTKLSRGWRQVGAAGLLGVDDRHRIVFTPSKAVRRDRLWVATPTAVDVVHVTALRATVVRVHTGGYTAQFVVPDARAEVPPLLPRLVRGRVRDTLTDPSRATGTGLMSPLDLVPHLEPDQVDAMVDDLYGTDAERARVLLDSLPAGELRRAAVALARDDVDRLADVVAHAHQDPWQTLQDARAL